MEENFYGYVKDRERKCLVLIQRKDRKTFYHHHCYSSSYNHSNVVEEFECVSLCIIFANSKMLYDSSRNDSNSRKHIHITLQYYTVELTS